LTRAGPQRAQLVAELEQLRAAADEREGLLAARAEQDAALHEHAARLEQALGELADERQQRARLAAELDSGAGLAQRVAAAEAQLAERAAELEDARRLQAQQRQQLARKEASLVELQERFALVERRLEEASEELRAVVEKERRLQEIEARAQQVRCGAGLSGGGGRWGGAVNR
jgi:chromosome segregation ATPase